MLKNFKIYIFIVLFYFLLIACTVSNYSVNNSAPKHTFDNSNKFKTSYQSNKNIDFGQYLSGVNSVIILTDEKFESSFSNDDEFFKKYHALLNNYFTSIGIKNIAITEDEKKWITNNIPMENITYFSLNLDNTKNFISSISMKFRSCNNDEFNFKFESDYYIDDKWDNYFYNKLKNMYWVYNEFNSEFSLSINRNFTEWDEESIKKYLNENDSDELEGIYEIYGVSNSTTENKYKVALLKDDSDYKIIYLDGAENSHNWKEGELKGIVSKSSIKDFYKVNWIMSDKSENENVFMNTSKSSFLEFDFLNNDAGYKINYIKMYPQYSNKLASTQNYITSGTGFFITQNGFIITNYHVVNDAKKIIVESSNFEEEKNYEAEIIYKDKKNDLALLKIISNEFKLNFEIPYQICNNENPIGTSVFTLGFPMIETMGENLKLSDGIISSNSGYMSNNSTYQVTVPINPGNSGGPLFNKDGNVVGVISAKFTGAENVTYAIKSKLLSDLLSKNEINKNLSSKNRIKNFDFTKQVNELKDFVCLIKIYE